MSMTINAEGQVEFDVPVTRKMKLVLGHSDVPEPFEEVPKACAICDVVKEPREFVPTNVAKGERGRLCWSCKRLYDRRGLHGLPWQADVAWSDRVNFDEARMALRALEMEIDHVRRT